MQKTLFLCSRMDLLGVEGLRSDLVQSCGNGSSAPFRLHIEDRPIIETEDARLFCARAIRECDGVVLVLEQGRSKVRNEKESAVLELEVMMAATSGKPVVVLDFSHNTNPLFYLLGSEFFGQGLQSAAIVRAASDAPGDQVRWLREALANICSGESSLVSQLNASAGWERLFRLRPDRLNQFEEDGGNFPFARRGGNFPRLETSDIRRFLDEAQNAYPTDKLRAMVSGWDAIRALSNRPWGSDSLDPVHAALWLRALSIWSGSMSWLGLFGHSSGASMMSILASLQIASRISTSETADGGPFAKHGYLGAIASNYFSLSGRVDTQAGKLAIQLRGIQYATEGLRATKQTDARAGLLSLRGILRLSTRRPTLALSGFRDLHQSVGMLRKAPAVQGASQRLATAQIQLGAAYKEVAKRLLREPMTLRYALRQLSEAHETLGGYNGPAINVEVGQYLMCSKHLVETLLLLKRESAAFELWRHSVKLAYDKGVMDQYQQLRGIGERAKFAEPEQESKGPGWIFPANNPEQTTIPPAQ